MKYRNGSAAGALVLGPVPDQEGEQAGEEQAQGEAVAEAGPARAGTSSRGRASRPSRPRRSGTTCDRAPRSSRRRPASASAPAADAVEQHPEGPDELESAAALAPLVEEQGQANTQRQERRSGRAGQIGRVHVSVAAWCVAIEAAGGVGRAGPRHPRRAPPAGPHPAPGAGRARPARRGTAVGPRRTGRPIRSGSVPESASRRGQVVDERGGLGLRPSPRRDVGRRRHRGARRAPRRVAGRPAGSISRSASSTALRTRSAVASVARVAPLVHAGQALRGGAQAGQRPGRRTAGRRRGARRSRRSKRRWPPGVVKASIRPSSAQRRSVSWSTPRSRLAGPRTASGGAAPRPVRRQVGSEVTGSLGVGENVGKSGYRRTALPGEDMARSRSTRVKRPRPRQGRVA